MNRTNFVDAASAEAREMTLLRSNTPTECGFDDVRLDKYTGNYFCACCKKNLGAKFREAVRLTLPPEWVQRLDKQCRGRA